MQNRHKKITEFIIALYSFPLIASGGMASASTVTTACAISSSASISPLAALYTKQFPKGCDGKRWQEIIQKIVPIKLVASKKLLHDSIVNGIAWNHNGTQLATASYDNKARIWNASGELLHTLAHKGLVIAVAWNPNGTQLATASEDKKARIWNASGELLHMLAHQDWVVAVAWNFNGTQLATGSHDQKARIWKATGKLRHTLEHQGPVYAVAWNPNGMQLATASEDKKARIWNASAELLHTLTHQDWVVAVAWNFNGTQLATGSHEQKARIWNDSGELLHTLAHQNLAYTVAWNPNGTQLVTGSTDGTARIWNASGELLHTLAHQNFAYTVAWNPNGTQLVTGSTDEAARIWNASGKLLHTLAHQNSVIATAWNPNGTLLATASSDNTARIWDTAHLTNPKYHEECNQLQAGTLAPATLMLIHLFDQFNSRKSKNNDQATLKEVADHAQTKGITTAALVNVLLTMHPVIMHGILKGYNVSIQKRLHNKGSALLEDDDIQESHSDSCNTLEHTLQALDWVDPRGPIANILEGYMVPEENYLDSYKALKQVLASIPLLSAAPIQKALEEYIVEGHSKIEEVNCAEQA